MGPSRPLRGPEAKGRLTKRAEGFRLLDAPENCSWGGKLDRDSDGVACEALC
ncbi:excalibur calcium-binding domain-containing protein [Mesorhizobium sp.]|uniref:excalibur calcium-binding domain-containing protein n=1 Tax=Mesorhizobium sp. TaxID=1871066 RepID=UPI003445686D